MLRTVTFAADADTSSYGVSCGGSLTDAPFGYGNALAYAGGVMLLACSGPTHGTSCQLWVAGGSGSSTLPGGCTLLLDASASVLQAFSFSMNSPSGNLLSIPLPDDPVFVGDLYFQVTWQDPSNSTITKTTNGIEARIR